MSWLEEFDAQLELGRDRLKQLSSDAASSRPRPAAWSIKEIVGHLVDSASNNHQRFVRAQFMDDLVFPPYAQDDWVRVQRYQDAPWPELVDWWYHFNRHIVHVIRATPKSLLYRETIEHNFDVIAWKTVPKGTPSTLEYFMKDYLGHLRHHLGQIESMLSRQT